MTGDERRLRIFNRYSSNWQLVYPKFSWTDNIPEGYRVGVLCPICLEVFNSSSLNQQLENPLSLEHLPPAKLGGKAKILTCKRCNNESGRLLDHTIGKYIKAEPFLRLDDGAEILGTTSFKHSNGKEINSRTIIRVESKNRFIFKAQIEKGEWREEQLKNVDPKAPISINFNFSAPSAKHVHIGFLRIAYLLAFEKFGHAFVLNEMYNGIRQQILEPNKEILAPFGSMLAKSVNVADGIYVSTPPFGLKSYLIVFTVKLKAEVQKVCVFLPSPFNDSAEYYQKFKELPSQNFSVDTSEKFLDVDFLNEEGYSFAFRNAFK